MRDIRADKLEETKETTLRVSLPPTLSATWLSPRVFQFLADHRHIRLRVDAKSYFEEVDWKGPFTPTWQNPNDDAELIKEWSVSAAATLGSSVRARGILLEIRARLPAAVRKSLHIEAGVLTLAMAETAKGAVDYFRRA